MCDYAKHYYQSVAHNTSGDKGIISYPTGTLFMQCNGYGLTLTENGPDITGIPCEEKDGCELYNHLFRHKPEERS